MKRLLQIVVFIVSVGIALPAWSMSPCDSVDQGLTDNSKAALAPVITRQLRAKTVDILQSFRFDGWTILYVDSHEADETFLFYSRDPLHSRYITMWSGAAASNEEQSIKNGMLKSAQGIPPRLAGCFAWYVTNNRKE
jgi:hypothetical protein